MKRKLISVLLCLALCLSLLSFSALAAEEKQYIAFGDSISAGYGIDNEADRFVNIVAAKNDYTLDNKAHNDGNTAAGILAQLQENNWDDAIRNAELITITCGGNDMMDLLYDMIAAEYNAGNDPDITPEQVPEILANASSNLMQALKLITAAQDVLEGDPANGVPAFADSDEFEAKLDAYITDLTAVMAYIRNLNETAIVIIPTQYNPYTAFAGGTYDVVATEVGRGAKKLSQAITETAAAADYLVADVYTAFENDSRNLCNASDDPINLDFHPTKDGHAVIAACMQEVLDSVTEEEPPVDNPVDPPIHNCPSAQFTDVDQNAWYHEAVDYAIEHGLMQGVGNNTFDPNGTTTRAQIVTILWRLEGEPAPAGANPFADVKADSWYADAVVWAAEEAIVNGYGDGSFAPNNNVTREQLAAILYRYAQYKGYDVSAGENTNILSFTDADEISSWAVDALQWAVAEGIMQGKGDGILDPAGTAKRCEVAKMMMNFLEN